MVKGWNQAMTGKATCCLDDYATDSDFILEQKVWRGSRQTSENHTGSIVNWQWGVAA